MGVRIRTPYLKSTQEKELVNEEISHIKIDSESRKRSEKRRVTESYDSSKDS